jgi:hypothetical protein
MTDRVRLRIEKWKRAKKGETEPGKLDLKKDIEVAKKKRKHKKTTHDSRNREQVFVFALFFSFLLTLVFPLFFSISRLNVNFFAFK